MLFDTSNDRVRMSRSELVALRLRAAQNGYAVNQIQNVSQALEAHLKALSPAILDDMVRFAETGTSPFTSCSSLEELEQEGFGGYLPQGK